MHTHLKKNLWRTALVFFMIGAIFAACVVPTPVVQTVEVTRLVPEVLVATFVVQETVLVTVESVDQPQATATSEAVGNLPTPTPSPTAANLAPVMAFPNARINSFGFRSDATFFITVDTGQILSGDYRAKVGNENFACVLVPKYPERIYCYGPLVQYGKILTLSIFTDDEQRTVLYETEFMAPLKSTTTPTPTVTPTVTPTP